MYNTLTHAAHTGIHYTTNHTTTTTYRTSAPRFNQNGSNAYNPAHCRSSIHFSPRAQSSLALMRLKQELCGGPFNRTMQRLGVGGPPQGCGFNPFPLSFPGFNRCGNDVSRAESRAPQAPQGKATEMKAGQTMKAPNGSLVTWGKDGNVGVKYRDADGRMRTVDVKNGMMRLDGGAPQKLENVGQLLKLPNGDVVGLGNNPAGPEGQKLCRVVLADNVDQVKTDPAGATNIYDVNNYRQTSTTVPVHHNLNFNSYAFATPFGPAGGMSASISAFTGMPTVTSRILQTLSYNSVK